MAPDKLTEINKRLHEKAASEVREAQVDSVGPTPADIDAVAGAFEGEAFRYCSDWLAAHTLMAKDTTPFAFVLSRSIENDIGALQARGVTCHQRFQAFRSQKMVDVGGMVVLTTMNLEQVIAISVADVKNSQQLLDAIGAFGMDDRHVIVFEPPKANIIFLARGLKGRSRAQNVVASGARLPWSLEQLEEEIRQFHEDWTRVPEAALMPWENAGKGVTINRLEKRISLALASFLDQQWSRRGSVLGEYPSNAGRIDVFLQEQVLEKGKGPCVIEVKVLRGCSTSKPTRQMHKDHSVRWAKKGVAQASLYRTDKKAPSAFLYCFDARDMDTDLPEVDTFAQSKNIEHRRHFMYRSTEKLQDAELATAGAT